MADLSKEQRDAIWDQTFKSMDGDFVCVSGGVRGRVEGCPFPHDQIAARPKKMPPISSETLLPDIIVEFDEDGALLNYWTTPAEPRLYAVDGSHIYVRQDNFAEDAWQYFKIHPSGEFTTVRNPISVYRERADCPEDIAMFIKPTHVECWKYTDLSSGSKRLFALDKPEFCRRTGPNVNRAYFDQAD